MTGVESLRLGIKKLRERGGVESECENLRQSVRQGLRVRGRLCETEKEAEGERGRS